MKEREREEKRPVRLAPAAICYSSSPWHPEQPLLWKGMCESGRETGSPSKAGAPAPLRSAPSCRRHFAPVPTAASRRFQNVSTLPHSQPGFSFFPLHHFGRRIRVIFAFCPEASVSEHSCIHICLGPARRNQAGHDLHRGSFVSRPIK